jgi:protoheme IX farnesyltransferase
VRDPTLLALAFVFFVWQVPHFWLLVALHAEGYEGAGFPTLVTLFGRPRLARLTWTWICATSASLALVPLFRAVTSGAAALVLALAALGLPLASLPLLRGDPGPRGFRKIFMHINLFALVLTAMVILDPYLRR